MKNTHISQIRKEKSSSILDAKITYMSKILKSGKIPKGFDSFHSDKKICDWTDTRIGIEKIRVGTARDKHPEAWRKIQFLKKELKSLQSKQNQNNINSSSEEKSSVHKKLESAKDRIHRLEDQLSKLVNEAVSIRAAYLDLVNAITENRDHYKNRIVADAIKRHFEHHGLQAVLDKDTP